MEPISSVVFLEEAIVDSTTDQGSVRRSEGASIVVAEQGGRQSEQGGRAEFQ